MSKYLDSENLAWKADNTIYTNKVSASLQINYLAKWRGISPDT